MVRRRLLPDISIVLVSRQRKAPKRRSSGAHAQRGPWLPLRRPDPDALSLTVFYPGLLIVFELFVSAVSAAR